MKRRTKLTPFAKIVILALVFLGARYVYLNQEKILVPEFWKSTDSTELIINNDTVSVNINNEIRIESMKDTVELFLTHNDSSIRIQTSDTIVVLQMKDTLLFTISEKDNKIGRIILN